MTKDPTTFSHHIYLSVSTVELILTDLTYIT